MLTKYENRELISFDGTCPMNCKHCYTYELDKKNLFRTSEQLVESLKDKKFDIIYVSQSFENFSNEKDGISLCQQLYNAYKKDIFIITRSFLSDKTIMELSRLNSIMNKEGKELFLAVSLCADISYDITEDTTRCPKPELRLSNLERAHRHNIKTILLLRPIFPNNIIPVKECINLIQQSSGYVAAVISSGLIATDAILKRLNIHRENIKFLAGGDSTYLDNIDPKKVQYLDVELELKEIEECCRTYKLPFFRHSMPALNYLKG